LIPHPPNFTPLIAGAIFLPFFLKDKWVIICLPILCLFISDYFLGFHDVMIWTYGSFFIIGLITNIFSTTKLKNLIGLSLSCPTVFFLISNFGVWLGSARYTQDFQGLIECYYLALPFYSSSLVSTILFSSLFYFCHNFFVNRNLSKQA
tara:strand:+ start:1464 stop:1910 length:447 start_codon:yes stop_codon:yes gene_type:complete